MIKKEQAEVVVEMVEDVLCDVTKKSLFKNKTPDGFIEVGIITYLKLSEEDVMSGDYDNAVEMESSEVSKEIYDKVIKYLRDMGGNVPSQYENSVENDDEGSMN